MGDLTTIVLAAAVFATAVAVAAIFRCTAGVFATAVSTIQTSAAVVTAAFRSTAACRSTAAFTARWLDS